MAKVKKVVAKQEAAEAAEKVITERQVKKVAELAGVAMEEAAGKNMIELETSLKWKVDPKLFLFRKVCGRVLKKDEATGQALPVPFATVHVEDTDCKLLGIFPKESAWAWFWPITCTRELIATATTDECGRFCVWIPRFDIDWIIKWRKERFCFPELFVKPSIREILEKFFREPPKVREPFPKPDPLPWYLKNNAELITEAERIIGREKVENLISLAGTAATGGSVKPLNRMMDEPAFQDDMMPIFPKEMLGRIEDKVRELSRDTDKKKKRDIPAPEPSRFIGPFLRCFDLIVPELKPIVDVPDITFRVTQDVDGDGDEEVIYSENFFDVRWNEGTIPDVELYASEIALTSVACNVPDVATEDEGIHFAGLMPVGVHAGGYHDNATGYALRPNRPHPSGLFSDALPNPDATTPFKGVLQLYGNNQHPGAQYYRVMFRYNGGSAAPFMSSWHLYRIHGGSLQKRLIAPDSDGWYAIIPTAEAWHPHNLLMNWATNAKGRYEVYMELGNASKSVMQTTASVIFQVDNTRPLPQFTKLEYREAGWLPSAWKEVDMKCAVIERTAKTDIDLRVSFEGSGGHFRSIRLSAGGCGGGTPVLSGDADTNEHWYTDPSDLFFSNAADPAEYSLPGTFPQGAYDFTLRADSRAFNPAGGDGGFDADWEYDPLYLYRWDTLRIAVVDK